MIQLFQPTPCLINSLWLLNLTRQPNPSGFNLICISGVAVTYEFVSSDDTNRNPIGAHSLIGMATYIG